MDGGLDRNWASMSSNRAVSAAATAAAVLSLASKIATDLLDADDLREGALDVAHSPASRSNDDAMSTTESEWTVIGPSDTGRAIANW